MLSQIIWKANRYFFFHQKGEIAAALFFPQNLGIRKLSCQVCRDRQSSLFLFRMIGMLYAGVKIGIADVPAQLVALDQVKVLPKIWGITGIWLAVSAAELLTLFVSLPVLMIKPYHI